MDYPLSDQEMRYYLPHAAVMTYPQMAAAAHEGHTLDSLMGTDGVLILLYEIERRRGHWTAVFRRDAALECFDSYGYVPDDELSFVPSHYKKQSMQDHTWLLRLLKKSGCRVEYNGAELQKPSSGVSTCGRHCIARIAFRAMPIEAYVKMMGPHCDETVLRSVPNPF
ncbi:MAG: hypothetical protein Q7U97_04255 [Rhodocyclaceae bacterium]|nr:hypothetical protein [Rhodocyclaceae bacterium]